MDHQIVDWKRVVIFLSFAFGIAWLAGLALHLTGGLATSPYILPLVTIGYMAAPAFAHVLTRLVTREGWKDLHLWPKFRRGWLYWMICWFAPAIFTFAGMVVFFTLFPEYYDPSLKTVQNLLGEAATSGSQSNAAIDPWFIVLSQAGVAILIAPVINVLFILGEEFGWRAYLQPKLMLFGVRKTMVLMGIIWGVWHAPLIAMGHNYGLNYPGSPWLGMLVMIWFTFIFGTFMGWAVLRAGSVWPAVIAHGGLNGLAGMVMFFIQGNPNLILGPSVAGIIGSLAIAAVALMIFLWPHALTPTE